MQTVCRPADLEMAKRTLYRLPDEARQVTVRCGTVWITQRNDPRDIILEPGQSFMPDGHRDVVLYALTPAALTLHTATIRRAAPPPAHTMHPARDLAIEQVSP